MTGRPYPEPERAEGETRITEAVQAITKWIDAEVEAGATDHLVDALRRKGWTVTPPPDPAACDTVQILVPDDGVTT
ncbi:hypothetical protein QDA00_gp16 [Microbacterium phage Matzah]|uniref:Uncharacterized protein n=1 Tax=Microbacterium phage Matzah TaxID=2686228 RepID=A0A6B9L659_9CAUD|nr:hypothetical protein QDA00_gp16 [Microbacterium phage Matzah]QHB37087.1 hypothetical protein SEA_MATZAH_94 [Microbacterium phage Matzah]